MAKIGFIGLGNMGLPMAQNLVKAGHEVSGFDLSEYAVERLAAGGGTRAASVADACRDAEFVISMLPAGEQVLEVYLGDGGVLPQRDRALADRLIDHRCGERARSGAGGGSARG